MARSTPDERSPAPACWWQPAFEVVAQQEEMPPLCSIRLEQGSGGWTEGRKPSYFVVAPTSRRNPAESSARSFQRRSLPFILANWYSNNTGSSSHRHDRSFKLVRYHYDGSFRPRPFVGAARHPPVSTAAVGQGSFHYVCSHFPVSGSLWSRAAALPAPPSKALTQGRRRARQISNSSRR